jgi:hypothetical protein
MIRFWRGVMAASTALVALASASFGTEKSTYTISGSQVHDGWVASTDNQASFAEATIRCDGTAGETYYKGLIRFDLQAIKASDFGTVKRAILRLNVTAADNPKLVPTIIAALDTAWNDRVVFSSPDGKGKWPIQRGYANIDYAAIAKCSLKQTIAKPGTLEIDVTSIVDHWLFQNVPNNGLLISTGGPVFGKPDLGTWKLALASSKSGSGPALIVEMAGSAPRPGSAEKTALRYYPSAFMAPVRSPYVFYWGFGAAPTYPGSVTNAMGGGPTDGQQLARLTLGWFYGPQDPYLKDEQGFIDYYVNAAKSGMLGIMVDEWQAAAAGQPMLEPANPFGITGSIKGILAAKNANPAFYIAVAWRGEKNIEGATKHGEPDLLMIEAYSHVAKSFPKEWGTNGYMGSPKRRIDTARKLGMIERTIPWLGMILARDDYHPGSRLTREELERQIVELRKYAPEMPGIAFYANGDPQLADAADKLAYQHYVEPAPNVVILEPTFQQVVTTPHQTIAAQAAPKDNRTILKYRWFVDNRLIAETAGPEQLWDVRGELAGMHILTVHAVDSAYNRSASQIPVWVAGK